MAKKMSYARWVETLKEGAEQGRTDGVFMYSRFKLKESNMGESLADRFAEYLNGYFKATCDTLSETARVSPFNQSDLIFALQLYAHRLAAAFRVREVISLPEVHRQRLASELAGAAADYVTSLEEHFKELRTADLQYQFLRCKKTISEF